MLKTYYSKNKEYIWLKLMYLGNSCGCHQIAKRSFNIKGYQFPICARCTGTWIGYVLSIGLYKYFMHSIFIDISFCLVMLLDWLVQRLKICESTNTRRLFTGTLCGYGFMNLFILLIVKIIHIIF